MNPNTTTLFIISSWQQADEIQKVARELKGVNKVPLEQVDDWYSVQGTIEWHDASHSLWKKKIQNHM
jgi:hypothetical protein